MINFIKMDVRRLFRSMNFYVILAIFMFITSINIYSTSINLKNRNENTVSMDSADEQDMSEENIDILIIQKKQITFADTLRDLYDGRNNEILFFVALIMTIFICTEYQSGYIKNICSIANYRWYNIISKTVTGIVVLLCVNLLGAGAYFFATKNLFQHVVVGSAITAFKTIGIQFLIQLAVVSLIIILCTLGRSKALCITMGILISTQLLPIPLVILASKILGIKGDTIA